MSLAAGNEEERRQLLTYLLQSVLLVNAMQLSLYTSSGLSSSEH